MCASENHRFSDVFRGYRNVTLDQNGLNENTVFDFRNDLFIKLKIACGLFLNIFLLH